MENYEQFYNLESYIFDKVRCRFIEQGYLSAFDFFCIVIWKANRAKSKIAKMLLSKKKGDNLDAIVKKLTAGLAKKSTPKGKMCYLIQKWGFKLPMASAILTALYPDEFTIYDVRVCDSLDAFHNLGSRSKFENIWSGYLDFKQKVEESAPKGLVLRDKDRYLWGKSFYNQLIDDIKTAFSQIDS